jgi:hypothetical protein
MSKQQVFLSGDKEMILYDIDYNLKDGEKLEDTFHNADELRKINMPLENQTASEVRVFIRSIKPILWTQFKITELDHVVVDVYGEPEIVWQGNLSECVYNGEPAILH